MPQKPGKAFCHENLEYLAAVMDYLHTLARKRIVAHKLEIKRGNML